MKIDIKDGEGFIKFTATGPGSVKIAYGYDMTGAQQRYVQNTADEDELWSMTTLISVLAGTMQVLDTDIDRLVEIGQQAIEDGVFEIGVSKDALRPDDLKKMSEEEIELYLADVKGNA